MAESPAGSRKMVSTRAAWRGSDDEESRAYLQSRLTVLSRLMFWSFAVLLGGMVLLYKQYRYLEPRDNDRIYMIAGVGVLILAIVWRGFLVRRELSLRTLYAIDLFYALGTGIIFASAAYIAWDFRVSAWANLLWSCFTMFLRTIVLPSTGRRTAVAGTLLFAPMVLASIGLSIKGSPELPPSAYIGGMLMIANVVILLSTIGSRLIYGLRRQVNAAMRLGQYTLDSKIGEGGNGSVYRAHHALLRRPTAIKIMLPDRVGADTIDRFEREVQAMSLLTHWNTVAIYDYGRSPDGVFYYAMEYLDGIDLENLVIDFGPQPSDRVIAILVQMCGALNEAHRRNIIHRDIKPANVLLCERGAVPDVAKVVDFGLAKEINADTGGDSTRSILGTPAYIAPEAVTDPATIGPPADLYAVGAVGYFLLTGRRVFEAKTNLDLCIQHVTATPKPPSTMTKNPIQPELEALILRCLAKSPAERPASADELAKLLREVPSARVWSDASALQWWDDFRRLPRPASASASTLTITVDIEHRDSDPPSEPPGPDVN
jgi:eukaryotic-like serine/threonine-protein kinase